MKKIAMIFAGAMLMVPAAAQAGYYGYNCQSASTVTVECTNGVKVYRGQALQYAPGQLQALASADKSGAKNRKLRAKLAHKSAKLRAQKQDIAKLERRVETLEQNRQRFSNRRVYTSAYGFNGFGFSPIASQRRNFGQRGPRRGAAVGNRGKRH